MQIAPMYSFGHQITEALREGPLWGSDLRDRLQVGPIEYKAYRSALDEECERGRVERIVLRNPADANAAILYRIRSAP